MDILNTDASSAAIDEVINRRASGVNFEDRAKSSVTKSVIASIEKAAASFSNQEIQKVQLFLDEKSRYKKMKPEAFREVIKDSAEILSALQQADSLYKAISGC